MSRKGVVFANYFVLTNRRTSEPDIPTILQFIHELAAYENASHEVEATETSLRETLSFADTTVSSSSSSSGKPRGGGGGAVHTFMLTPPSSTQPVGMALFFYNYSTWRAAPGVYLEDLYVQPSQRGKGYGFALLRALAAEVRRIGGRRLEWSVLHWNEPSIRFYEGLGARRMDEWLKMMVEGEDALGRLAEG